MCFDDDDREFMERLERDLQVEENNFSSGEEMMFRALEYMHTYGQAINAVL